MTSWIFLEEMQRKFNNAFESQNPAMFDIVFDIDGKKLFADKLRLTLASTTFESMFSDRWGYKDDVIPIKNYKFDDFKRFLLFIYSGKCDLNDSNIMAMLDMAAFYQIERLKELCEEYLSKMEYTVDNIFEFIEVCDKYFLIHLKELCDKSLSKMEYTMDNIFQFIEVSDKYSLVRMKKTLQNFITKIKKDFLFTKEELNDILEYVRCNITVKVTNLFGESIFGHLKPEYSDAIKKIRSLKNRPSNNTESLVLYWSNVNCKFPSSPSQFKPNDDVKDHLVVFSDGNIGVVRSPFGAYTLAEMISENYFEFTPNCKIEIE
uniref:BTB domain-containing protein n=1 Tax=Panagrolaimus davidi TaxID=227884 RepID=A0A914P6G1_9BILA